MTIPESQLLTWSNRGADVAAQNTHKSIRIALEGSWRLQNRQVETFLQGSYRNATNVRADSDVDLVAMLEGSWIADISALPPDQQALYRSQTHDAVYGWPDFRTGVLETLQDYFGAANVQPGKKAIKITAASNRLPADVVVAIEYRRYQHYRGINEQRFDQGIWFRDANGRAIVNFPKQHFDNGAAKNAKERTREQFKPVVRMIKNARGCLCDRRVIADGLAPSYFVQGLLYNVPDTCFETSLQRTFVNAVNWLSDKSSPYTSFVCQNGLVPLFGDTPEQWTTERARNFVNALIRLWNEWG